MESIVVACVQQRMSILASREEFEGDARRFLHQAQAKVAGLVVFPELAGLMLAPPLISSSKLGLIKRADQGKRPSAGLISRGLGRVSEAAAGMAGGGFRGSLLRLLEKNSAALRDLYLETFGSLAREFKTPLLGGSLYLYDEETQSLRNRAYLFDVSGEVLGYQDKLNLSAEEQGLIVPGEELRVFDTRMGRFGLLLGQDVMYPELGRLLTVQGAELILGIAACPGQVQADLFRRALASRCEENQVYGAAAFLVGPNYLGQEDKEDYHGQSALLAPILLTERRDGVLTQVGTNRTEGFIAARMDADGLHSLWETSRLRTRREMRLGNLGSVLAEMYEKGLTIEQAIEQRIVGPVEQQVPVQEMLPAPLPESEAGFEPQLMPEPEAVLEPQPVPEPEVVLEPELAPKPQEPETDTLAEATVVATPQIGAGEEDRAEQ